MSSASEQQVIVIGASTGGVEAMLSIAERLPPRFDAPVLLVQHIGAHPSYLPELLNRRGPNPARRAEHGEVPEPGTIYVAPPDFHMRLEDGRIRVWRGPKEQHARPAINPLFRSAALECGRRAVGVVLTGLLDDGTAGLKAVKECGGLAVVQNPADAQEPSMPSSALANVEVDHVATIEEMPELLCRLARPRAPAPAVAVPLALRREHAASFGDPEMDDLRAIAAPSAFTCPDCGGALFELDDKRPIRFICHTGHSYSLRSLAFMQEEVTEGALWTSLRALQEKEAILRRLAGMEAAEQPGSEVGAIAEAEELAKVIVVLRRFAEEAPSNKSFSAVP